MKKLLSPLQVGHQTLRNRVVMAPLTRSRASQPGDIPSALNVEYYAQRATAGLIVSEATQVSRQGQGYALTPGIYTDAQEAGWTQVVQAVHAQHGRIALQLWHVGRISHSLLQENGAAPVAPSALIAKGAQCFVIQPDGTAENVPTETPRALSTDELPGIVAQYRQAAVRGKRAGFDLMEVHAANGYLLHQFLSTNSNQRTDAYGGTLENRARLTLEVLDAVIAEIGADRVGVRLSPHFAAHDIADAEAEASALYLAQAFSARGIAYLHIAEPDWAGGPELDDDYRRALREAHPGPIVGAGGYDRAKADRLIGAGLVDAAAFGRTFIANPDLPRRLAEDLPLNEQRPESFYGGDAEGYTDYPAYGAA